VNPLIRLIEEKAADKTAMMDTTYDDGQD